MWRVTAKFADGSEKVRYRRTARGADKLATSFREERREETWGHESYEERVLPAAASVVVEMSEEVTWK